MALALSCRDGDAKRDGAMFRHGAPFHHVWRPKKKGRPGGTAPAHAMGCMKGSALLAILIVAAFLLAAALLATLFILLVLLVGLAGLTALLTGILVLVCHLTLS
ncbi:hypothetical protein VH570_03610 [Sphingobium sp. HT1-2]